MNANLPLDQDSKGERIIAVDVLRGFALLGIFYAHMIFWYAGGPLKEETYRLYQDPGSGIAMVILMGLVMSKFFSLFSFLFGLSFYIQIQKLAERGETIWLKFGWRLLILGAIGFVHHLLWRADILTIYVPLGLLLIFARHLSNKVVLLLGMVLILNLPTKVAECISIILRNQLPLITTNNLAEGLAYSAILEHGTFTEMVKHNWFAFVDKWVYQINSGRMLITFGYFLLGMYVGRLGWFSNIAQYKENFTRLLKGSAKLLGLTLICGVAFGAIIHAMGIEIPTAPWAGWAGGFIWELLNTSVVFIYIAGISLLMQRPRWSRFLSPLAAAGKMALTTYLCQTLIGLSLFFPIGMHLFTLTSLGQNALLCIAIFGLQLFVCHYWLQYFNYGPMEWLWRSATDLKWRPFVKASRLLDTASTSP